MFNNPPNPASPHPNAYTEAEERWWEQRHNTSDVGNVERKITAVFGCTQGAKELKVSTL